MSGKRYKEEDQRGGTHGESEQGEISGEMKTGAVKGRHASMQKVCDQLSLEIRRPSGHVHLPMSSVLTH